MPSNQIEAFAKRSRALVKKKKEEIRRLLAEQSDHRRRRARGIDLPKGGHDPVTDSSFLLIPAFDGDDGTRPIPSGVPAWHSPAVNVISAAGDPNTPLEIAQGRLSPQLIAGQGYVFEAWVHNLGDMAAPTVNVEFYKRLPGMGANSDNADFLGATVISVPRNDKARATLPYQATVADAGHWCLHVRASSFNPPDTPDNWSSLSARQERHVGQQNITVVQASSEMVVAVSALLIGATKSRKMQLVIEPQAPPKHLAKNACVAGVLGMR